MIYAILLILSYLLGSIPFGFLIVKLAGKGDIRRHSSGSTGATNVSRLLGIKGFIITWVLDMAKTVAPFLVAKSIVGPDFGALCGLVAVAAHIFPVWLGFKGGKGISSIFGFLISMNPIAFVSSGLIWLVGAMPSGYSSFGSVLMLVAMPVFGFAISFWTGVICVLLAILGLWGNRENITRLLKGNESKMQMNLGKLTLAFVLAGLVAIGLIVWLA